MSDDFTPAKFWAGFGKWFGVGLFTAAVIAGLVVGGWRAGWWFSNQNATRSYQQTQNGTSNQDTLRAQITSGMTQLTAEGVQAAGAKGDPGMVGQIKVEEAAQAGQLCTDMQQVTGVALPPQQLAWYNANCSLGVLTPTSTYYIPVAP
jgi:hypothetical protein